MTGSIFKHIVEFYDGIQYTIPNHPSISVFRNHSNTDFHVALTWKKYVVLSFTESGGAILTLPPSSDMSQYDFFTKGFQNIPSLIDWWNSNQTKIMLGEINMIGNIFKSFKTSIKWMLTAMFLNQIFLFLVSFPNEKLSVFIFAGSIFVLTIDSYGKLVTMITKYVWNIPDHEMSMKGNQIICVIVGILLATLVFYITSGVVSDAVSMIRNYYGLPEILWWLPDTK